VDLATSDARISNSGLRPALLNRLAPALALALVGADENHI
jgi:hypothetical protein